MKARHCISTVSKLRKSQQGVPDAARRRPPASRLSPGQGGLPRNSSRESASFWVYGRLRGAFKNSQTQASHAAARLPRPLLRPPGPAPALGTGPPPATAARGPKDKEGGHAEGADAEDALDPAPHAAPALGPRCASFSRVPGPVPPPPGRRPRSPPPPPSRPGPQALGPVPPRPGPHTLLPGRGSARPPGPPPGRWRPSPRTREPAAEGAAGRRPGLLGSGTAALAAAVAAATILALSFLSFLQQQTGSASHGGSAATTLPPEPDAAHAPRSAHPAFPKVPRCPGSRRRRACAVDTASPRLAGGACGIPAFCFGARKPAAGLPLRHRLSVFCAGVSGVS